MKAVHRGVIPLEALRQELPNYLAHCHGIPLETDIRQFWNNRRATLPIFFFLFCRFALMQPSSATAERVFSLLKQMFGSQQESALKDYVETSVMLAYNHRESQLHQLPEGQDLMNFFLLFFLCHDPASYLCITVSSITLILYVSF